jgi:hypothetical protein
VPTSFGRALTKASIPAGVSRLPDPASPALAESAAGDVAEAEASAEAAPALDRGSAPPETRPGRSPGYG